MNTDLLPITIHIDAVEGTTNVPWYVIVDMTKIKHQLQRAMEDEELSKIIDIDDDYIESIIFDLVRGPFFSYASAEKALPLVKSRCYMSAAAKIYCIPGWPNSEYEQAYRQVVKECEMVPD